MVKYFKITKKNYRSAIKRLKKTNPVVCTVGGGKIRAKSAKFSLAKRASGKYTLLARRK